jgi:hypothetical protein
VIDRPHSFQNKVAGLEISSYLYVIKLKDMKTPLVQEALDLFVQTMPMEDMAADHPMFWELYEKECKIFELFGHMTEDEHDTYRKAVIKLRGH